jgi:hypothetical protein
LPCYNSRSSGSSSDVSSDGSSSQQRSVLQPTAEDDAVIAASNRISRFMDFRERCASEVVNKLVELGYARQLALKVLQRMQDTVSGTMQVCPQQMTQQVVTTVQAVPECCSTWQNNKWAGEPRRQLSPCTCLTTNMNHHALLALALMLRWVHQWSVWSCQ